MEVAFQLYSFHCLRPGNFDLHTKIPGCAPARAVVHKCPVCADLLLVGRRSERPCRRLVNITLTENSNLISWQLVAF